MKYNIRISYRSGQEEYIPALCEEHEIKSIMKLVHECMLSGAVGVLEIPERHNNLIHHVRLSEVQHATYMGVKDA